MPPPDVRPDSRPADARLADPHESRVVLIGAARYAYLPDLPAVDGNLDGLHDVLTDGARWGLPDRNLRIIGDTGDPRVPAAALREAAAEVGPDGLLLVYYAGHGLIDPDSGALLLALRETDPETPYETGLHYESVRRAVRRSAARRRVVILDCCYAGRASAEMGAGTVVVADRAEIDQTCLLVSAAANRPARAPAGAPYTAFTGELIALLRDGLPGAGPLLDVEMLFATLYRTLQAKGQEVPELRARNAGDSIPLVRNAAADAPEPVPAWSADRDLAGRVLLAAPDLDDPDVWRAAVLVLRYHPEHGALGVRLNVRTDRPVARVAEGWAALAADPAVVFDGGPVNAGGLVAVALLRPGAQAPVGFRPIRDRLGTVALTADAAALRPALTGVRLFSGYLGWAPGQLEADLAAGRFVRADATPGVALSARTDLLWGSLRRR